MKAKCGKCQKTGHLTKCCKTKEVISKDQNSEDSLKTNSMKMHGLQLLSSRVKNSESSGSQRNKSVKLQNEEYVKSAKKFEVRPAKPSPKVEITIRLDMEAYYNHQPRLECNLLNSFLDKMRTAPMLPHKVMAITDTGAQATVMGDKHLHGIGFDRFSLHATTVTMDCPNNVKLDAFGVFFGYIRAKCPNTGDTLLHRGMVYVVKGDIMLLSESALMDLGIIPRTFPQVGQFGGYKQPDDGIVTFSPEGIYQHDQSHKPLTFAEIECEEPHKLGDIDDKTSDTALPPSPPIITAKQPVGECDPESPLPCRCPRRKFIDPPDKIPMPATDSNINALEDWIRDYFKESAFNQCRRQPWPMTTGKPMRIHTKPDTKPYCCKRPTMIPIHFRDQIRADIESDVKKGVLERVPEGRPDTWCSRMVIQPKKNGTARRTVDLSYLSKHGLDESHHTRSAPMVAKSVPANKYKSTLDCVDGYHGIVLAEEDRHKTTFATEFGKFQYTRAPQGYLSSGDSYGRYTDNILEDCPTTLMTRDWEKIVDDIITWSDTIEGAFLRICSLLSHCNKHGLVFSPQKFKFARKEVEFAGFLITEKGI